MSDCCESAVGGSQYNCCCSNKGCEFDTDMILWVLIIIVIVSCLSD